MTVGPSDPRRGACLGPTRRALLRDPLGFLHEDHLRERVICARIDAVAGGGTPDPAGVADIVAFLRHELPLHLQDEEEDLFPLLLRRCVPEDEIGRVIARLTLDHRHADTDTPRILAELGSLAAGTAALSPEMRARLARYAGHARRHLILENAIVLPFARLRPTGRDLETLRLRMMQRRGIDRPTEAPDADRPH
ncbi:hemerythrin domain-containing protein [Rhodobacteraceae bacterium CCMM004]|nr:hemerythrin domain-containing protein [Rhodobacteraceae bacterium CCMM004]